MSEINGFHIDIDRLGNNEHSRHRYKTVYSIIQLVIDLLFPIILCVTLGILSKDDFPVNQLGFFCDDTTIRYPFRHSTIPFYYLYLFLILIFSIFIILTTIEHCSHRYERKRIQTITQPKMLEVELNLIFRKIKIPFWIWKLAYTTYPFIVGYLITNVVTYTFKLSVGELRPYFHDVCRANFSLFACKSMTGDYVYVTNYTCTGDLGLVREARLSFPSGHASLITYAMTFLILYLETKQYIPRGARSALSILFSLVALLVSLSRLGDFKHHLHDIMAGMAIGVLTAAVTYLNYLRLNVQSVQVDRPEAVTVRTPFLGRYSELKDD